MSSHREYERDFGWSWLRNEGPGEGRLRFERVGAEGQGDESHSGGNEGQGNEGQRHEGQGNEGNEKDEDEYELIVPKDWSTRVRPYC